MASQCVQTILYTTYVNLLISGIILMMRELMASLAMEAAMPYPHFPFFIFLRTWISFCTLWHTWEVHNYNLTLDTMYPFIDYMEGECYAQLYLPWIPRNPSLWNLLLTFFYISMTSSSPFTMWTYPSLALVNIVNIWFNAWSVLLHILPCATPHSHNSKIINILPFSNMVI